MKAEDLVKLQQSEVYKLLVSGEVSDGEFARYINMVCNRMLDGVFMS
jgi:hypothetical protein